MYIWQEKDFPNFIYNIESVLQRLSDVKLAIGRLTGMMGALGFEVKKTAALDSITADILMSSAIEGITLNRDDFLPAATIVKTVFIVCRLPLPKTENRITTFWNAHKKAV